MTDADIDLVRVYVATEAALIPLAKSLLEGERIDFIARGEGLQDLFGGGQIGGFNYVVGPVEFLVRSEDAERARALLTDLRATGEGEAATDDERAAD